MTALPCAAAVTLMRLASFFAASLAYNLALVLSARASARFVARLLRLMNRPMVAAFRSSAIGETGFVDRCA